MNIKDSKIYEVILFERNKYKDNIMKGLEIVKSFIISKKFILTGGMAIDFALRLKGSKLYEDYVLPDYDFYCTNTPGDAYELAKELCVKGVKNIKVQNAIHVNTVKIACDGYWIADITYIPKEVYAIIPTLATPDGLIFEHPHFKMINQFRVLSTPFERPPQETINFRWEKDIKRLNLLISCYPLLEIETPKKWYDIKISPKELKGKCLGGFCALAAWHQLAIDKGFKSDVEFKVKNNTYHVPIDMISIGDDTPKCTVKGDYYEEFLEFVPARAVDKNVETLFTHGTQYGCHKFNGIDIFTPYFLLEYFLSYYFLDWNGKKDIYMFAAAHLAKIVKWANEKEYNEFMPTYEIYGRYNFHKSNIKGRLFTLIRLKEIKLDWKMEPPAVILDENCAVPNEVEFNSDTCKLYNMSGKKVDKIHIWNLPE